MENNENLIKWLTLHSKLLNLKNISLMAGLKSTAIYDMLRGKNKGNSATYKKVEIIAKYFGYNPMQNYELIEGLRLSFILGEVKYLEISSAENVLQEIVKVLPNSYVVGDTIHETKGDDIDADTVIWQVESCEPAEGNFIAKLKFLCFL